MRSIARAIVVVATYCKALCPEHALTVENRPRRTRPGAPTARLRSATAISEIPPTFRPPAHRRRALPARPRRVAPGRYTPATPMPSLDRVRRLRAPRKSTGFGGAMKRQSAAAGCADRNLRLEPPSLRLTHERVVAASGDWLNARGERCSGQLHGRTQHRDWHGRSTACRLVGVSRDHRCRWRGGRRHEDNWHGLPRGGQRHPGVGRIHRGPLRTFVRELARRGRLRSCRLAVGASALGSLPRLTTQRCVLTSAGRRHKVPWPRPPAPNYVR
jgi:hypothetical protein